MGPRPLCFVSLGSGAGPGRDTHLSLTGPRAIVSSLRAELGLAGWPGPMPGMSPGTSPCREPPTGCGGRSAQRWFRGYCCLSNTTSPLLAFSSVFLTRLPMLFSLLNSQCLEQCLVGARNSVEGQMRWDTIFQ